MRRTARAGDGLYRYGGEEFLVLLHDADAGTLQAVGQRYLRALQGAAIAHPENTPFGVVTASGGASLLHRGNCMDVDSALRDADQALYSAKARGRNKVEIKTQAAAGQLVEIDRQRAAS